MKRGTLLNSEISYVISKMGHKDQLVLADAGLPIPNGMQRIDLAVAKNLPSFMPVLAAVLSEQRVEKVIMAEEIKTVSPILHEEVLRKLQELEIKDDIKIQIDYVSHEAFKGLVASGKAVIRTGEFTPYANIILISGVAF